MKVEFEKQNELIARARNGDLRAREDLVRDNMFVAKQEAYKLMKDKYMTNEEREDEVQQAYLYLTIAIDNMIKGDKGYNVQYLRTIIRNRLISWHRTEKYGVDNSSIKDEQKREQLRNIKRCESIDDYEIESNENFENDVINKMMVEQLMEKLTEEEQEIIRLMFYEQLKQDEIGKRLGIKQCTVSVKYKNIIKKLRGE